MTKEVRLIVLKTSAMPALGTFEATKFEPWGLVAEDTRIPIILTNHKETHDQLTELGQQSVLLEFFRVPGVEALEADNEDFDGSKLLSGLSKNIVALTGMLDYTPKWAGRTVAVVVGGDTRHGPQFDDKAIEANIVPVSVLAHFCKTISENEGAIINFKGVLSPEMVELTKTALALLKTREDLPQIIAAGNKVLRAKLSKAEALAAKKQGGMAEATAALDGIMQK